MKKIQKLGMLAMAGAVALGGLGLIGGESASANSSAPNELNVNYNSMDTFSVSYGSIVQSGNVISVATQIFDKHLGGWAIGAPTRLKFSNGSGSKVAYGPTYNTNSAGFTYANVTVPSSFALNGELCTVQLQVFEDGGWHNADNVSGSSGNYAYTQVYYSN